MQFKDVPAGTFFRASGHHYQKRDSTLAIQMFAKRVVAFQGFDDVAPMSTGECEPNTKKHEPVFTSVCIEAHGINGFADNIHKQNYKWWHDKETGQRLIRNKGELLCLIHSEISEAMEGERTDANDKHLPHRKSAEVELGDAVIRIFDYCAGFGYDLQGAINEKLEYNRTRADHTHEEREKAGGKKF